MKRLLYIGILFFLCTACERDLMSYEGKEAIYFAVQSGNSWGSENDWPYMPYTSAEFGRITEDTLMVRIKVMITGPQKDYPRPFQVVVNPDSTTAREGVDFRVLASEYILEANSSSAYVPVLLYRQPEMKTDTVVLGLKLVANDYFSLTFNEFNKMEKYQNGDVVYEQFDATMHKILITDVMAQPSQWANFEFGQFTSKKLILMCEEFGYTYEDFQNPAKITYLQQYIIAQQFSKILNEAYNNNDPILDEDGTLMWVNGCVYPKGTLPQ